jgi:hypothetical protein
MIGMAETSPAMTDRVSFPAGAKAEGKGIHSAERVSGSPSLAFGSPGMTQADKAARIPLFAFPHIHPPPLMRAARNRIYRPLDADAILELD